MNYLFEILRSDPWEIERASGVNEEQKKEGGRGSLKLHTHGCSQKGKFKKKMSRSEATLYSLFIILYTPETKTPEDCNVIHPGLLSGSILNHSIRHVTTHEAFQQVIH